MNNKSNFRRGSAELLILHLLSQQDYYATANAIQQVLKYTVIQEDEGEKIDKSQKHESIYKSRAETA